MHQSGESVNVRENGANALKIMINYIVVFLDKRTILFLNLKHCIIQQEQQMLITQNRHE